jgi:hypothetical protein
MFKIKRFSLVFLFIFLIFGLLTPVSALAAELSQTLASDGAQWQECSLGDSVADSLRSQFDTQIALVGGGELGYSLISGQISDADLENALPVDSPISTVTLTPAQLTQLLESLLGHGTAEGNSYLDTELSAFDGFPQLSGLTLTYDITAPAGSRLVSLALEDGTVLDTSDDTTQLALAATLPLLDGTYGPEISGAEPTGLTLRQVFSAYLSEHSDLETPQTGRISVKGLGGEPLINKVPFVLILIATVLIGVFSYSRQHRDAKFFTFDPYA